MYNIQTKLKRTVVDRRTAEPTGRTTRKHHRHRSRTRQAACTCRTGAHAGRCCPRRLASHLELLTFKLTIRERWVPK